MASILRRIVVAALLAAWSFPAAAATAQSQPTPIVEKAQSARTADTTAPRSRSTPTREQQAPANQNFQGGGVASTSAAACSRRR